MKFKDKFSLLVLMAVITIATGLYVGIVRPLIPELLHGSAPVWLQSIADSFYPRLSAESQRLSPAFFIQKADQIVFRFGLAAACFCCWWLYKKQLFRVSVLPSPSGKSITYLRAGFYGFIFITTYDWWGSIPAIVDQAAFYKPISFLRLFNVPLPSVTTLRTLYVLLLLSTGCTMLGWKARWSGYISISLFIILQAFFTSFEKSDHGYITYIYVGLLFPLALEARAAQQVFVLFAIRAAVALSYFMAGMEKLLNSGLSWLQPTTFRTFLTLHDTPAGLWFAQYDLLCLLLPFFAMVFQLTFPATLFLARHRYWWPVAGVLFHWGTVVLFGISSFFNPWIVVYLFFLVRSRPLSSHPQKTSIA